MAGQDTMTGESTIRALSHILPAQTIRRQLLNAINVYLWTTATITQQTQPGLQSLANPGATTLGTQTGATTTDETSAQTTDTGKQPQALALPAGATPSTATTTAPQPAMSPTATSATTATARPALPTPKATTERPTAAKRHKDEGKGRAKKTATYNQPTSKH